MAWTPDGRRVHASQAEPTSDWVVYVEGSPDRTESGRWLLTVVSDLLEIPRLGKPEWVFALVRELSGFETPSGRRYRCPCCDYLTLTEPPPGTHATCPVCRWEDDATQYCEVDYKGGANKVSLRQGRDNYRDYGYSDPKRAPRVRPPTPEERGLA